MRQKRLEAYFFLTLTAIIWALGGVVIKQTLKDVSPGIFLTVRFFISSLICVPIVFAKKMHFPKKTDFLKLLLISLFGTTINIGFLFYGVKYTSVNDLAVISAVAPILTVFAAALFLKEHISKHEKIGTIITIIGAFVMIILPIIETHGDGFSNVLGNVLLMISNLGWVGFAIFSKEVLRERVHPFLITTVGFVVGFITLLPMAIMESRGSLLTTVLNLPLAAYIGILYMAVLSGVVAYFLYQLGQKTIEVSEAALFSYLQSVFTVIFAVTLLQEPFTPPFIIGSCIVIFGIIIAETRRRMV